MLHNCALIIRTDDSALAIDVFSKGIYPFDGIDEENIIAAMSGKGFFKEIKATLYTHIHPDHYDKELNDSFTKKFNIPTFVPDSNLGKDGRFDIGNFSVRYHKIRHSGKEYRDVIHYVLLINAEGKNIYIAGDADFNSKEHLEFLSDIKVDAAFFNPFYLSAQIPIIRLVSAKMAYIYHIPKEYDHDNIRQLAISSYRHNSDIWDICKLICSYPYTIKL